jgi:hypothetical protein
MFFDQSWMGYGIVGALEAGAIALVIGLVAFVLLHLFGRSQGWGLGIEVGWACLGGVILAGGSDMWNLVYFNYGRVQSLQLLKVRLAEVHDPDNLGARVFFEFVGVAVGVFIGWLLVARRRSSP